MMKIQRDTKGQPFIEWEQAPGGYKRAWIRKPDDPELDWARTGRYVNVARIEALGEGPSGQSADFPVFNDLPDEQILKAFVQTVSAITGYKLWWKKVVIGSGVMFFLWGAWKFKKRG